jgi:hypothetical protein
MNDFEAEGRTLQHSQAARHAMALRQSLLGNMAWHAAHAQKHVEEHADTPKLQAMLDELAVLERQIDAQLHEANRAAARAGKAGLTRTHLVQAQPRSI